MNEHLARTDRRPPKTTSLAGLAGRFLKRGAIAFGGPVAPGLILEILNLWKIHERLRLSAAGVLWGTGLPARG